MFWIRSRFKIGRLTALSDAFIYHWCLLVNFGSLSRCWYLWHFAHAATELSKLISPPRPLCFISCMCIADSVIGESQSSQWLSLRTKIVWRIRLTAVVRSIEAIARIPDLNAIFSFLKIRTGRPLSPISTQT